MMGMRRDAARVPRYAGLTAKEKQDSQDAERLNSRLGILAVFEFRSREQTRIG